MSYMETLQRVISERTDQKRISPAWVATEVMTVIEPRLEVARVAYELAHAQLRQLARSLLRGKFESDDGSFEQHELFPDLQKRYPIKKQTGEEPEYALLEDLTDEDLVYNENRLRAEGAKKIQHADALKAYRRTRMAA